MAWTTVATTNFGDSSGTYGYVYLQYDSASTGTSRSSRLRMELKSGASVYIYVDNLKLDGNSVKGRFLCQGTMDFWTGSLSAGTHSFTWSCPWYSGTRSYTCSGNIPSGVTAPSGLSVSIKSKTYNSVTFNTSVSSYGIPASTSGRYIEAAVLGQNAYGVSYRFNTASNTTSSTITVNNSSPSNPTSFSIEGNHLYWYGGYATNTQASTSKVVGSFYTPCPPLASLTADTHSYKTATIDEVKINFTRNSDGGAEARTGYYRYSSDGGTNYSAWSSFGTVSETSSSFSVSLPTSSNIILQAKLNTPNGGDSTTKTITFSTLSTHNPPIFSNFNYYDLNPKTSLLTGDNKTMIQGQSTPVIEISSTNKAQPSDGVAVSNYSVTFTGQSQVVKYGSGTTLINLVPPSDSGTCALSVSAIDKVSSSTTITKNVTVYPWSKPVVVASISRQNNFESNSILKVSGTYSPVIINGLTKNTLEVSFRCKKAQESSWGSWITLAKTLNGSSWSVKDYAISLDNNFQWDVEVSVTDQFETIVSKLVLAMGMPNFFIGTDGRVSIGCKPTKNKVSDKNGQLEINGQLYIQNGGGRNADAAIRVESNKLDVDTQVSVKRTDTNKEVWLGVGSGGINHGVYSQSQSKWMLHSDDNNTYVNGINISAIALLNRFYPVGSIYTSTTASTASSVSNALGGGTWTRITDYEVVAYAYLSSATSIATSKNISSVTGSSGTYKCNFSKAMSNANYLVYVSGEVGGAGQEIVGVYGKTTTGFSYDFTNYAGSLVTPTQVDILILGTLATPEKYVWKRTA